jgi:dethiobiotin synthetase
LVIVPPVKSQFLFVTGSDTGVGKTVLAALLVRHLRESGVRVAGLKPICSGGRGDARALRAAAGKVLSLDAVNPWHFRAALAPVLAARKENRRVRLRQVVAHIRRVAKGFECVVVEGAGGLLSPLGVDFDSRDLLCALSAKPLVVCANRLGAVNQALLVLEALPRVLANQAQVILSTVKPNAASAGNVKLLSERLELRRVHVLPPIQFKQPTSPMIRRALRALAD